MPDTAQPPTFFATPAEFRAWLQRHHADHTELLVGFWKKDTGKPSITWPQSVDEALSFGWIDGVRRSLGSEAYTIRFTPRKASSTWSAVNIKRMAELIAEGRVHPAGMAAFERRREDRTAIYSYEQRSAELPEEYATVFRQHPAAWEYFQAQRASYRKPAVWWIISAKQQATRERRLAKLIECSANGDWLPQLKWSGGGG